jgi:hypothetical protein
VKELFGDLPDVIFVGGPRYLAMFLRNSGSADTPADMSSGRTDMTRLPAAPNC